MTHCPYCTFDVSPASSFCPTCTVGLSFPAPDRCEQVLPVIRAGHSLVSADFRTSDLPDDPHLRPELAGMFSRVPSGVLVSHKDAATLQHIHRELDTRDVCVRASFTCLDPGARIGLTARRELLGTVETAYTFEVDVHGRKAWMNRLLVYEAPKRRKVEVCSLGVVRSASVAAYGQPNRLELRVQGTTLRALINDHEVLAIHDPVYCTGSAGIRVGRGTPADGAIVRVICHDFAIGGVAA